MRQHIVGFTSVLCIALAALTILSCSERASQSARGELTTLETNLGHPGDWSIKIDHPSYTNRQSYAAMLAFNGDLTGFGEQVTVVRDRYGKVGVSVHTGAEGDFYLADGHCVDTSSNSMCHIAELDEWRSLYENAIDAANSRGADI